MSGHEEMLQPVAVQEAEAAFLACCLSEPECLDAAMADGLEKEVFSVPANQTTFSAMQRIRDRGDGLDYILLQEELSAVGELHAVGGVSYLGALISMDVIPSRSEQYLAILKDGYQLRRFQKQATDLQKISSESRRFSQLMESAQLHLSRMSELAIEEESTSWTEIVDAAKRRTELRIQGKEQEAGNPLYTGLVDFDLKLKPFDVATQDFLVIVAGLPSQGKSSLAMQVVAYNVLKHKKRAAVFQLETGNEDYVEQMSAQWTAVNLQKMPEEAERRPKDVKRHLATLDHLRENVIGQSLWIYEKDFFVEQIVSRARHLHASQGGLDLIVVDYIQLVETRERFNVREQAVSYVARQLKLLGKRLGVTVVALAQVDRNLEKENRYPRKSDLRESAGLEQAADRIVIIWRPTKDHRGYEQKPNQEVFEQWLCQVKFRKGATGHRSFLFACPYTRFKDQPNVAEDGSYKKKGDY